MGDRDMVQSLGKTSTDKGGEGMRIGIAYTMWNDEIIDALRTGCKTQLQARGVKDEDIVELKTSGSYELPYTATCLIAEYQLDAVVCIGCLIKGETMHFEYICEAVTQGIMRVNLDTGVPTLFGVLTVLTKEQACARAGLVDAKSNHGAEWADAAINQASLKRQCRPERLIAKPAATSMTRWAIAIGIGMLAGVMLAKAR